MSPLISNPAQRPVIVGIPCDYRMIGQHGFHAVAERYISAVRDGVGALPLLIPVLPTPIPPEEILAAVDGLLFPGSPSNVAPHRYGGPSPRDGVLQDEARDATTLPLLSAAIAAAMPVFCICRGFQELNVALGGTLHQHVHEVTGRKDHRAKSALPLDEQFGDAHEVHAAEGGLLEKLAARKIFVVNSLHGQGVDRLASSLRVEATADDGTIEAVSMPKARGFVFGTQWHPEWRHAANPVSRALLSAFGDAVRDFARARHREAVP